MAKKVTRTVTVQEVNVIATNLNTLETTRMSVPIYEIGPDDSQNLIKKAVEESLGMATSGECTLVAIESFGEARDVVVSMPVFQFCTMGTIKESVEESENE